MPRGGIKSVFFGERGGRLGFYVQKCSLKDAQQCNKLRGIAFKFNIWHLLCKMMAVVHCTVVQLYSCTVVQLYSSTALQRACINPGMLESGIPAKCDICRQFLSDFQTNFVY